jgi:hypothetical protein
VLGRRLIRGVNEKQIVELFALVRLLQQEDKEPRDLDIINNTGVDNNLDNSEFKYILTKQYSYSREHKLVAIDYF